MKRFIYFMTFHPKSVNLTYWQHFCFSLKLSRIFLSASIKALIHSIFPFLYIESSSQYSNIINKLLEKNL